MDNINTVEIGGEFRALGTLRITTKPAGATAYVLPRGAYDASTMSSVIPANYIDAGKTELVTRPIKVGTYDVVVVFEGGKRLVEIVTVKPGENRFDFPAIPADGKDGE